MLATYEGDLTEWPPFSNEIVAVNIPSSEVRGLVHYQNASAEYFSQAQAVISPSGRYIGWAQSTSAADVGFAVYETGGLGANEIINTCVSSKPESTLSDPKRSDSVVID